jgi:hypothetical protein
VNRNSARLLELVFPPRNRLPPQYFGVPRIGGRRRGEKLRRTLRRYQAWRSSGLVVFDGKRRALFAAVGRLPLRSFLRMSPYRRLRRSPDLFRLQKVVTLAGRRQACLSGSPPEAAQPPLILSLKLALLLGQRRCLYINARRRRRRSRRCLYINARRRRRRSCRCLCL